MGKNKIDIFEDEDYAKVVLYNKNGEESHQVKISIEDIELVGAYRWAYNWRSGASSIINGKHIGINRYITNAQNDERVFWINKDKLDSRRCNLEIRKYKARP